MPDTFGTGSPLATATVDVEPVYGFGTGSPLAQATVAVESIDTFGTGSPLATATVGVATDNAIWLMGPSGPVAAELLLMSEL